MCAVSVVGPICLTFLFYFYIFFYLFCEEKTLISKTTTMTPNRRTHQQRQTQLLKLMHSQKDVCNIFTYPIV